MLAAENRSLPDSSACKRETEHPTDCQLQNDSSIICTYVWFREPYV